MNWNKIRQQVVERDNNTCQICLKKVESLEVNHIIPKRLKGLNSVNNLFSVCRQCHDIVELRPSPKTVEDRIQEFSNGNCRDFIYCECKCGFTRSKYNEKGKIMRFIPGHQNRGKDYHSMELHNELPKFNNGKYIECEGGFIEFVYCKCECGKTRSKYRIRDGKACKSEPMDYIRGHENRGRKPHNYGKRKVILFEEFIYCACSCGFTRPKYDNNGREHKFIEGHNNRGKKGLKGGAHITNGYRFILNPDHHLADSKGYVTEHRLNYEKYHKCCLLSWAAIHHINENKLDNTIENLEGMTQKQHKILHGKEFNRFENYHKKSESITNQFGTFKKKVFRV